MGSDWPPISLGIEEAGLQAATMCRQKPGHLVPGATDFHSLKKVSRVGDFRVETDFVKNFSKFANDYLSIRSFLIDCPRLRGKLMVDDRSPAAKAMSVVSQIMTIALSGILPVAVGYGLDNWLQTKPWLLILLGLFGFATAIYQLVRLVKRLEQDAKADSAVDD